MDYEKLHKLILSTRNMQYLGFDEKKYKPEHFEPIYNEITKHFKCPKV